MTTLLPGFDLQLGAAAETLAVRSRRPWRRWHGAGAITLAIVSLSGVAYASKGLWSPQLGDDLRGHPTATASDLPAAQLEHFGVLRREQTDRDRDGAALYALKMQSASIGSIRTAGVRRVDRVADEGNAIVLIPAVLGEKRASKKAPQDRDRLCLWLRDPVDGGGQSCATTAEALGGKLLLMMFPPPQLTAQQRQRMMDYLKAAQAKAKREGSNSVMIPGEIGNPPGSQRPGKVVGLVPDGVVTVKVGKETVPVVDNIFVAEAMMEESADEKPVWLDADGKVVPVLREGALPQYLPRPPWAQ